MGQIASSRLLTHQRRNKGFLSQDAHVTVSKSVDQTAAKLCENAVSHGLDFLNLADVSAGATRQWPALSGEKMMIIDALSDPRTTVYGPLSS